jgi:hypothetical protein
MPKQRFHPTSVLAALSCFVHQAVNGCRLHALVQVSAVASGGLEPVLQPGILRWAQLTTRSALIQLLLRPHYWAP